MFRIALGLGVAALLSCPAQASGKSDLKSGYAALLRHDYSHAIRYLTSAIEAGDLSRANLALAYHYRGAEYLKTDRYDEAIDDLGRAIALEARLPTAYSDRGIAYRKKGDYENAIADYSAAIRIWPNWHDWYFNRGLAYAATGRHDEAIADFGKALFFKPDFPTRMLRAPMLTWRNGGPLKRLPITAGRSEQSQKFGKSIRASQRGWRCSTRHLDV